ncbi:poly(A) RNA polymerase gld-2 homolog B-like [Uranotaenia lowii]|uniref:poly(A) RNA polymerase gld-2 homolog B-like n=1 Tax=Uranotaenia lowii TaxID=190385 RepID=UPI002479B509|nr:poly(A) RNA polymerase gld-2 homolog B-like [Uranotaenia lowii]
MSTKKMHPPAVIQHATGQTGGKGGLLPTQGGGKAATKDRQNVENIVPTSNGTEGATNGSSSSQNASAGAANNVVPGGGKKGATTKTNTGGTMVINSTNLGKPVIAVGGSAMSTLNTTNRRKNHRINSPNRRRQEQQTIFNSLKAWNDKIAPAFKSITAEKKSSTATGAEPKVIAEKANKPKSDYKGTVNNGPSPAVSGTSGGNSNTSNNSNSNSNSVSINGSISSTSSSNSNTNHKTTANKKSSYQQPSSMAIPVVSAANPAVGVLMVQPSSSSSSIKKPEDVTAGCNNGGSNAPPSGGNGVVAQAHGNTNPPRPSNSDPSKSSSVKLDKKPLSTNVSYGNGASHHRNQLSTSAGCFVPNSTHGTVQQDSVSSCSNGTSVVTTVSSGSTNGAIASGGTNANKSGSTRSSNAGKVLLPNVHPLTGAPLDPVSMFQGKMRNSMKMENFLVGPQSHIPHHHHHSNGLGHQQGQAPQHGPGQQQQSLPAPTSPHYSLDFLHYVGMRMSNGTSQPGGNTTTAVTTTPFRTNPHFTYGNFNQQLHHHQHVLHQPQPYGHQHLQRHYPGNFYATNEEQLVVQSNGGGASSVIASAAVSDSGFNTTFGVTEHVLNISAGAASNGSGSTDAVPYGYSQNQNHHHHHQNHPPGGGTHQSYSNGGGHQSYHHNNNYQQHNRNYNRGGQSAAQHNGNSQGGKRSWYNNWHGKKGGMGNGKYGGKGFNNGYRKNYHYYNNNHHLNGHNVYDHQYLMHQHPDHLRSLVYLRGYDRGFGAPPSHSSASRSPTPSPQSESPAIEGTHDNNSSMTLPAASVPDDKSDSGIEEVVRNLKKLNTAPNSSSSSSSVVSIPSTDSSAVHSVASQSNNIDMSCTTGHGYESDSSHSSGFNSHSYRQRKYANSGQVYRSSSSTSSGVSSTATYPPHLADHTLPASSTAVSTPTATNSQVADFFLRSQSYHGSHQNLTVASENASPNPPGSPVGLPMQLVSTQSMPMFSELFTGQKPNQNQLLQSKTRQSELGEGNHTSLYGSNSSLELTLQPGNHSDPPTGPGSTSSVISTASNASNSSLTSNGSSSGYSSSIAPCSTVPSNEPNLIQGGYSKRRQSGRQSPILISSTTKSGRSSFGSAGTSVSTIAPESNHQTSQSQPASPTSPSSAHRKQESAWNQSRALIPVAPAQVSVAQPQQTAFSPLYAEVPTMSDLNNFHTPADRYLARAHLVEMTEPPSELAPAGSKWESLSQAVWDKFISTQQTQQKFVVKIQLWRVLFMFVRKAFPRLSLYLVGSTVSGFASDSSDVDMCLVCRTGAVPFDIRGEALFQLGQLKNYFMNINTSFEEFSVIQAKVPILRFRDSSNSIVVDLNYNNCVGIRNSHLLYCYSQLDWRLRPLTLVVKLWAQHHNINDAKNMTISSYSLVLMVIHFLQYGVNPPILPCLHAMYPDKFVRMSDISHLDLMEAMEPYKNDNTQTIGELFLQFLEYYANFDYSLYAISVRTASVIPIESARVARSYKNDPHHWRQLCIEEPFDLTNTARSVFDADIFEQIKAVFSTCWRRLKDTNDLSSVFECEPLFIPVASTLSLTS